MVYSISEVAKEIKCSKRWYRKNVKNMPIEKMPKEIQKEFKNCHC